MKPMKFFLFSIAFLVTAFPVYAEVYTVEIGQFEKVKVNGNLSVIYKNLPDSTGYARYEAPAGSEGIFSFVTKGDGNLRVEPEDDNWSIQGLPVVYIYSDFLTSLESYSDREITVASLAPCASFNVRQVGNGTIYVENIKSNNVTASLTTGNGSIYLNGSCVNANYRMLGTGLISADRLRADNVKCRIMGTGSIGCWAVDNLKVVGLGSTKIYYKGSPKIKKTGGGKLFDLPEEMDQDIYEKISTPVTLSDSRDEDDEDDEEEEEEENYQTVVTNDD